MQFWTGQAIKKYPQFFAKSQNPLYLAFAGVVLKTEELHHELWDNLLLSIFKAPFRVNSTAS